MRAKQMHFTLTTEESRETIRPFKPPPPVVAANIRSYVIFTLSYCHLI